MEDSTTQLVLIHRPAVQFPMVDYDEVALYHVDAKHYRNGKLTAWKKEDRARWRETIGFAILDSLGNPVFQNIERRMLSQKQRKELHSIFLIPENKGRISETKCLAFFRDAVVFYRNKTWVAQAQICFHCRQIAFSSDTSDLADRFGTDGDWSRLQTFVSSVKGF